MASGRISIFIEAVTDKFKAGLAKAESDIESFSDRASAIGGRLRSVGRDLTFGVTLPVAFAATKVVGWAGAMEDAAAMSRQVFGSMASDIDRWAAGSARAFGLSKGEALEWASQIGIRLRTVGGMAEAEAARTSKNLVQLAGDFASAFGGSVAEAAQAISSGLTGEFEPLKRYGVVLNDTMLKAELFRLTGQDVKGTLTAQQKQVAALSAITQQASLVSGDYARNAQGWTNVQRTLTAELRNAGTAIGSLMLPVVTDLAQWLTRLVDRFRELSPTTQKVIIVVAGLAAAAGPLLFILGGLASAVGALASPVGAVVAAIAAAAAGMVALYQRSETFRNVVDRVARVVRGAFGSAIEWVKDDLLPALGRAWEAITPHLASVAEWFGEKIAPVLSDVGQLFSAVARRVVEAVNLIVTVVRDHGPQIIAAVQPVWTFVKSVIENSLRSISGIIQFVTGLISGDWSKAWEGIKNFFAGSVGNILSLASNLLSGVASVIGRVAERIGAFLLSLPGRVRDAMAGAGRWLVDVGSDIIEGLWRGMKQFWDRTVGGWLSGLGGVIRKLKGPIAVDRVLLRPEGAAIMAGLGDGLRSGWGEIADWLGARGADISGALAASVAAPSLSPAAIPAVGAVSGAGGGQVVEVHFHGPVAGDGEGWVVDMLSRALRQGRIQASQVMPV